MRIRNAVPIVKCTRTSESRKPFPNPEKKPCPLLIEGAGLWLLGKELVKRRGERNATKREKEGQRLHFWKTQNRAGKLPEKIKRRKPLFCVAPSKKIADFPKSAWNISPVRRIGAVVLTRENAFSLDESLEFNLFGRRIAVAAASAFALDDIVDGFGRASASRRSALLFFQRRLRRRLRARRRFPFPRRGKGFFILRALALAILPADFCEANGVHSQKARDE